MRFFAYICLALVIIGCHSCNKQPVKTKLNIVFILADDLGWPQLGCYGSDYYETPNLDRLASEGMRFTNAYAACAVCSPTRASIMTGKYPARLHLTDFIAGNNRTDYMLTQPDWQKLLPLEEVTIAEILHDQGYHTALYGKWHLSPEKKPPESLPYNPDKQGFDKCIVTYKPDQFSDPENDAHNVDSITDAAIDFLNRHQNDPFFLFVSHNSIHDPLMERKSLIEKYEQKKDAGKPENNPVIGAMIETLDKSIGRILNKLTELELDKNTIIVFFSDNGSKESYAKQTPLRSGKGWLYEGGVRVPLIIRLPGLIEAGSVSDDIVASNDLLPTLTNLLTIKNIQKNTDGIPFDNVLLGNGRGKRDKMYWHYPHYHVGSGMVPGAAMRKEHYKLIEWYEKSLTGQDGAFELYDLENDISEEHDLSDEMPDKLEELKTLLDQWKSQVNVQMPTIHKDLN